MSIADKLTTIAENTPKVFNAGYSKGKAEGSTSKEEQEKTVPITQNGTTEVLPDEGKTLSKVTVDVQVKDSFDADAYFEQKFKECIEGRTTTSFVGTFSGSMFDDISFKPTCDMVVDGSAQQMFSGCRITNLKQILEDRNVKLDTSKCNYWITFIAYSTITHLPCISFEGTTEFSTNGAFQRAMKLIYIEKIITKRELVWGVLTFQGSTALETIAEIEGEIGTSLNMDSCSKLDDLTIDNIINAYADMTGQTAPILTVHPTVKAKIEANETWLNTLINKNVTLA